MNESIMFYRKNLILNTARQLLERVVNELGLVYIGYYVGLGEHSVIVRYRGRDDNTSFTAFTVSVYSSFDNLPVHINEPQVPYCIVSVNKNIKNHLSQVFQQILYNDDDYDFETVFRKVCNIISNWKPDEVVK